MLITCSGCESKIKVPDAAAGKRVKCPKCATIIRVPKAETPDPPPSPEPEPPDEESKAPPEEPLDEPEPQEPEEEPEETAKTRVTASKSKASAIRAKSSRSKSRDEDDDDDDKPRSKRGRRDDDDDDDDDDDKPRSKRGRRDDDDDDLDVRKRRGRKKGSNSLAMTSMITGIIGVVIALPGCCCCGFIHIATLACGIAAVICGHMSIKSPGNEGQALTGLICGYVAIALSLIGAVFMILHLFFNIGANIGGFNNPAFNNPGFNQPPRFNQPPPPRFR
jgi:predicted Zn finger-like uncharacterized protein